MLTEHGDPVVFKIGTHELPLLTLVLPNGAMRLGGGGLPTRARTA